MNEKYKNKVTAAKKLHEKARYLRGRFLNTVAVIERDIAVILTEYFCTTDETIRELFFTKVAKKMSLEKKRQILIELVKNEYPRYWKEHKQFLVDLQKIQEFRNKLAHSVLDVTDEALSRPIEEGVGFIQWKQGNPITDKEFEDFEVRATMLSTTLEEIKLLLPYREIPVT